MPVMSSMAGCMDEPLSSCKACVDELADPAVAKHDSVCASNPKLCQGLQQYGNTWCELASKREFPYKQSGYDLLGIELSYQ